MEVEAAKKESVGSLFKKLNLPKKKKAQPHKVKKNIKSKAISKGEQYKDKLDARKQKAKRK